MPVYIRSETKKYNLNVWIFKKWMQSVLEELKCGDRELSVLFVNDQKMKKLNNQYRKLDRSTDVLSFPQSENGLKGYDSPLLGDVVVSTETAWRQSLDHKLSIEEEMILLLIHGTLHLLGYDHESSGKEAEIMKKKTKTLFQKIFPGRMASRTSDF